jgi:acetyl esterase
MATESNMETRTVDPAVDPLIDTHVRAFLKELNTNADEPLEKKTPEAARAVLSGAQA